MKKQAEIARLLKGSRHEAEQFIREVNSKLPQRASISQIAHALGKLPEDRRTLQDVLSALGVVAEETGVKASPVSTADKPPALHDQAARAPQVAVRTKTATAAPALKANWREFAAILKSCGITRLYHFTDSSNLASIRRWGGLFSWYYCETHGIEISCPGGTGLSRRLDVRHGLQDYVRLNFNPNPPMLHVARHITSPVILEVDPSVVYWATTLFSNVNATDNMAFVGDDLESFRCINFEVATDRYWQGEAEKKLRQAEVMVKTRIPLSYIRLPGGF